MWSRSELHVIYFFKPRMRHFLSRPTRRKFRIVCRRLLPPETSCCHQVVVEDQPQCKLPPSLELRTRNSS